MAEKTKTELQEEITNLTTENNSLKEKLAVAQAGTTTELQEEITNLTTENNSLKEKLAAAQAVTTAVDTSELESAIKKLKEEAEQKDALIESMKSSPAVADARSVKVAPEVMIQLVAAKLQGGVKTPATHEDALGLVESLKPLALALSK